MTRLLFITLLTCIVQSTFGQAIYSNGLINNGLNSNIPATNIAANSIASTWPNTNNLGNAGYIAGASGGYPIAGNVAQNLVMELPLSAITSPGVPLAEVTPIGVGDVAVTGEIPVGGSTAVSGNVPVIGYVTFEGYLPAGGMVTVANNCACNGEAPTPVV